MFIYDDSEDELLKIEKHPTELKKTPGISTSISTQYFDNFGKAQHIFRKKHRSLTRHDLESGTIKKNYAK